MIAGFFLLAGINVAAICCAAGFAGTTTKEDGMPLVIGMVILGSIGGMASFVTSLHVSSMGYRSDHWSRLLIVLGFAPVPLFFGILFMAKWLGYLPQH